MPHYLDFRMLANFGFANPSPPAARKAEAPFASTPLEAQGATTRKDNQSTSCIRSASTLIVGDDLDLQGLFPALLALDVGNGA